MTEAKDPLKSLYVHVGMVLFLTVMVLAFSLIYLKAPSDTSMTGMVLLEYPDLGISEGWNDFVDIVKYSPAHGYIMITLYTLWILVFGIAAVVVHEYKK